jgi:hypothetical protein
MLSEPPLVIQGTRQGASFVEQASRRVSDIKHVIDKSGDCKQPDRLESKSCPSEKCGKILLIEEYQASDTEYPHTQFNSP